MVPVGDFLPRVIPYVTGCPEPMAKQALVDSAIDFCERSLAIRENLARFTTVVGTDYYVLDVPSFQNQISRVLSVVLDGTALTPVAEDDAYMLTEYSGIPHSFSARRTGSIFEMRLHPIPDAVSAVDVHVALQPVRAADTLDDDLFNVWAEPVIEGALARLLRVPNQPFTDGAYSVNMSASADEKINKARIESYNGRTRSSQTVRMRPFA